MDNNAVDMALRLRNLAIEYQQKDGRSMGTFSCAEVLVVAEYALRKRAVDDTVPDWQELDVELGQIR